MDYNNRGTSIDAVIIRKGKVLLVLRARDPFKHHWALPGGYVEWDESVEDSVRREVQEETGLSVKELDLVGVYSAPSRHPKQTIAIAYRVEVTSSETPKAGDDAAETRWFSLRELPNDLAFDHRRIISDALKPKP